MSTVPKQPRCPHCGRPVDENLLGLCAQCMIKAGMAGQQTAGPGWAPAEPPSVEELSASFPQLEIIEFLGRGGMGAVYKARQKQLGRIVALKILPPSVGDGPAFAARFTREAQALAQLNHPHIVTLYEFGSTPGPQPIYFFLMEFVDGVNLRQVMSGGRMEAKQALAIVPQICDALQFAHDRGIVHRDIKPENILLARDGTVKIADFGVAKIVAEKGESQQAGELKHTGVAETLGGSVLGTPAYMAPEQVERPADVDHRADIYSLGVVLYQMLTGELPGKPIEPPSHKVQIDVRLDEVVLRALQQKPEMRFGQASVFKTQVQTIAGGDMGAATKVVTQQRLVIRLMGACVVAAMLVVGIIGFVQHITALIAMFFAFVISALVTWVAVRIARAKGFRYAVGGGIAVVSIATILGSAYLWLHVPEPSILPAVTAPGPIPPRAIALIDELRDLPSSHPNWRSDRRVCQELIGAIRQRAAELQRLLAGTIAERIADVNMAQFQARNLQLRDQDFVQEFQKELEVEARELKRLAQGDAAVGVSPPAATAPLAPRRYPQMSDQDRAVAIQKELEALSRAMERAAATQPASTAPREHGPKTPDGKADVLPLSADRQAEASAGKRTPLAPGTKLQHFVPVPGMPEKTSWGVHDKPSELNPEGWMIMTHMTLGGVAFARMPGEDKDFCRLRLVDGNDDWVTLEVTDMVLNRTMRVTVNRDVLSEITVNNDRYGLVFPTITVSSDQPDSSPSVFIIMTHADAARPTTARATKPIPPEAATLLDQIKRVPSAYPDWSSNPDARRAMVQSVDKKTADMYVLLKGTAAEPLLVSQKQHLSEFQSALGAGDQARIRAAQEKLDATGKELERVIRSGTAAATQPSVPPER